MTSTLQNYYQALTEPEKLRGQYYTPDELVWMMLDDLHLAPSHLVIDPSCGDGSFLRGVVASVARRYQGADCQALAKHWAGRIIGFDVHEVAAARARVRLREAFKQYLGVDVPATDLQVHQANVLGYSCLTQLLRTHGIPELRRGDRLLVIGNPPYVEAKRLSRETKRTLRAHHPDAIVGAPDLYLYFLAVCLGWLRDRDTLAFVLPNKLLVNSNAQRIRERLLDEGRLQSLWFATQTSVFPGAAVYPIVLFAGGPCQEHASRVDIVRLIRNASGQLVQGERAEGDAALYCRTRVKAIFPSPETAILQTALDSMFRSEGGRLDDLLDIRWTVSFHRAGLRERYVTPIRPEDPCARPFVGGGPFSGNGEVTRYRLEWAGWWIRYDTAALQADKNPLPDVVMFERPKLVICQNGRSLRVAYDETGCVLKDTFLSGVVREREHPLCRRPRALVGLLCSRAVHFYYSHVFYGGHVNGGYLHFLRSFLVDIPLGQWAEGAAEAVEALVRRRGEADPAEWEALEEEIETHVSAALGLTAEQAEAIAAWAAADANWQARERVRPVSTP
jgi:hypothetical protein